MSEEAGRSTEADVRDEQPDQASGGGRETEPEDSGHESEEPPEPDADADVQPEASAEEPEDLPEPDGDADVQQEEPAEEPEELPEPDGDADVQPEASEHESEESLEPAAEPDKRSEASDGDSDESPNPAGEPDLHPESAEEELADDDEEEDTQEVAPRPVREQEHEPGREYEYEPEFDDDYAEQAQPGWGQPPVDLKQRSTRFPWPPTRLFVALAVACVVLGMIGDFLLHRYDTGAPQITGAQVQTLHLDGVWVGPGGSKITLSGSPGDGTFTFSNMSPLTFVISAGDWPPTVNGGTWSLGKMQGSQWSETGLVFKGSPDPADRYAPQLMLLPIGSASSPQLACYYPVNAGICVFKRQ